MKEISAANVVELVAMARFIGDDEIMKAFLRLLNEMVRARDTLSRISDNHFDNGKLCGEVLGIKSVILFLEKNREEFKKKKTEET